MGLGWPRWRYGRQWGGWHGTNVVAAGDGRDTNAIAIPARKDRRKMQKRIWKRGRCAGAEVCPLSRVQAGAIVCIKRLATAPEVTDRLRELGLCEEQRIKLLARQSTYICQVCNALLPISGKLADSIMNCNLSIILCLIDFFGKLAAKRAVRILVDICGKYGSALLEKSLADEGERATLRGLAETASRWMTSEQWVDNFVLFLRCQICSPRREN